MSIKGNMKAKTSNKNNNKVLIAKLLRFGDEFHYVCPNCFTFYNGGLYCSDCGKRIEKKEDK